MTYAVGQIIEVCLNLDLPPTRGIRRIVAILVNEHEGVIELTDVPARVSECVLQDPSQTALRGRAAHPGVYELRELKVKDLQGVTHVNAPKVNFGVGDTPEVVEWRATSRGAHHREDFPEEADGWQKNILCAADEGGDMHLWTEPVGEVPAEIQKALDEDYSLDYHYLE